MDSVFNRLNNINVSDKIEKKGKLSYLSWAWAWETFKSNVPSGNYKIYETENGMFYHHDGKTAWVKVSVTAEELEHIEYLPVMDFKNQSITIDKVTSMDVNKAIQRALTKAIARHGLGLYIYAGEDLPIDDDGEPMKFYKTPSKQTPQDKKEYWTEFSVICKSLDVEPLDFISEWMQLDMEDKPAVQGAVAKYLKDKNMFADQLQNYKDNKNNS